MRIFLAGATGAVGKRLVPMLVEAGHSVVGTTRSEAKAATIRDAGGEPAILDAFDQPAVIAAVRDAQPDAVVHQLTALSDSPNMRHFDREFAVTNRLRTEALDILLDAAREVGATRFIAQSYTGWPNEREGSPVKTEDDPPDPRPPKSQRETFAAIRYVDATVPTVPGMRGFALRYGTLYGPGTSLGRRGALLDLVARRRLPIVGSGTGIWSFTHIDDAAGAVLAALEAESPGVYNIVDDEPAPVSEWLPALAAAIGAKPPRRVPVFLGRLVGGDALVSVMTSIRGSSNAKAKRTLGWHPRYPSWREGFRTGLG